MYREPVLLPHKTMRSCTENQFSFLTRLCDHVQRTSSPSSQDYVIMYRIPVLLPHKTMRSCTEYQFSFLTRLCDHVRRTSSPFSLLHLQPKPPDWRL
ncbi:hypothetical protein BaRGS_00000162 [Batillaria attramentaria]|uniref:Uncharacterized protein n=1 Tax=Batillaria attramentaria TaxID=370345 RepID=A0ABD0MBR0_9CAEN